MRLLGVGLSGLNVFCAMMDLADKFNNHLYYNAVDNIYLATKSLSEAIFKKAAIEEKELNVKNGFPQDELIVSGDGSWAKRGFTSLIGICSLIGKYTGKLVDCFVSSKTCKSCEVNRKSMDPTEFLVWQQTEHADECSVNYEGSSGGMEVQGVVEMFGRSENLHDAKYAYYIGDGDSKTFTNLLDAQPYKDFIVQKLECVLHVGKRMFRRLKEVKKTLTQIKKLKKKEEDKIKEQEKKEGAENPPPAKRGRRSKNDPHAEKPAKTTDLTGKVMKEMSLFYSLAIQNNPDDLQAMKNAIWAGYYHRISTDKNPQHQFCCKSWCKYLKSKDEGKTPEPHKPPLSDLVQEYVKPVYEDLTNDELLRRCLGKNTQNNNEPFNATVWSLVPKHLFSGKKIVELSTWICACIFNEGSTSLLKLYEIMGLEIGPHSYKHVREKDEERVKCAEKRCSDASKQARMNRKKDAAEREELYEQALGLLYGPGIAD